MRPAILAFAPALSLACAASTEAPAIGDCAQTEPDAADPYADCVEALTPVEGSDFNHDALPEVVLGPPGGPLDVASLGCGGSITLYFAEPAIVDGVGADFIVFENPFSLDFPEAGRVSVSANGDDWAAFDCDPDTLEGCAGIEPVLATADPEIDPTDPATAGGDAFDLAAVGVPIARYVRIDDVSEPYWAAQDTDYCDPGQAGKGGFDLDAIAAVNVED